MSSLDSTVITGAKTLFHFYCMAYLFKMRMYLYRLLALADLLLLMCFRQTLLLVLMPLGRSSASLFCFFICNMWSFIIFLVFFIWAYFQILKGSFPSDNLPYHSVQPCWVKFCLSQTRCTFPEFLYEIFDRAIPFIELPPLYIILLEN